ncbi:MAG: SH3 domain-containing protein [Desulfobacteraceae bacterium]
MKIAIIIYKPLLWGMLFFISALILPVNSYAWYGESWGDISRSTIETLATKMMKNTWTPKNTISNWGYRSTSHTFSKGTTYTGMAYSQNNPQETWSEFSDLVKSTTGGSTGYGSDCSGFVSIAWKLPSRYTTSIFESDATKSGGYVTSLGAVGSGQNADLQIGDALNKSASHIILFKKRTSSGIISMEQTPWTARSREWSWSQLSQYRPIRRYNLTSEKDTSNTIAGTVTTNGGNLNVRTGPDTSYTVVDSLANGSNVTIQCRTSGQSVNGKLGTSDQWYRIGTQKFSSAAYISASGSTQVCE